MALYTLGFWPKCGVSVPVIAMMLQVLPPPPAVKVGSAGAAKQEPVVVPPPPKRQPVTVPPRTVSSYVPPSGITPEVRMIVPEMLRFSKTGKLRDPTFSKPDPALFAKPKACHPSASNPADPLGGGLCPKAPPYAPTEEQIEQNKFGEESPKKRKASASDEYTVCKKEPWMTIVKVEMA